MRTDLLIAELTRNLKPVNRRRPWREALALAVLCAIEIALFLGIGFMRPDMPLAMHQPSFWWKASSLVLIALVSGTVTIMSLNPTHSPRKGLRWLVGLVATCLATGWLVDASRDGFTTLAQRLDWPDGIGCAIKMVILSLPAVVAFGVLMRQGAPTDRTGTAVAAGVTAAAWGAFIFAFACPFDDPLYLAVWYSVGCGAVTLFARAVFPWLARW
jgi:hypothetical protein